MWSVDPCSLNRRFLQSLDPLHFLAIAKAVGQYDSGRNEQYAAAQIRMLRDQASELMFALLGALTQCPQGVLLWMLAYKNEDLDDVLKAIHTGSAILTVNGEVTTSWQSIADRITSVVAPEELGDHAVELAKFWKVLAHEFLDRDARSEYNSLKHGLRASPGGASVSFTPEKSPGVKDPEAPTTTLHGSGFGSRFYVAERIGTQKLHFRIVEHHRSWTPKSLLIQLDLIVTSVQNIIQRLLVANRSTGDFTYRRPIQSEVFHASWKNDGLLRNFHVGPDISETDITCLTKEELIAYCKPNSTTPQTPPTPPSPS